MVYTSTTGENWILWGVSLYLRGGKQTTALYLLREGQEPANRQHGKPHKVAKLPPNYTIFEYPNGTAVLRKA